jgi:hypothetical protein
MEGVERSKEAALRLQITISITQTSDTSSFPPHFGAQVSDTRLIDRSIGQIKQETETVRGVRWAIGREGSFWQWDHLCAMEKGVCKQLQTNEHDEASETKKMGISAYRGSKGGVGKGLEMWSQDSATVLNSADLKLKNFT